MPTANTIKCKQAREWGSALAPKVSILSHSTGSLRFRLEIEPEPQVRQTGRSGSYNPGAIKYNAWKIACREALKESLRQAGLSGSFPIKGLVRLTCKFYVSDGRRFKVCDLGNYTKALEDMINICSKEKDPKYPDSTEALPIWQDDRFVVAYGEGHGKYETDKPLGWVEVLIESVKPFPKGRTQGLKR